MSSDECSPLAHGDIVVSRSDPTEFGTIVRVRSVNRPLSTDRYSRPFTSEWVYSIQWDCGDFNHEVAEWSVRKLDLLEQLAYVSGTRRHRHHQVKFEL